MSILDFNTCRILPSRRIQIRNVFLLAKMTFFFYALFDGFGCVILLTPQMPFHPHPKMTQHMIEEEEERLGGGGGGGTAQLIY